MQLRWIALAVLFAFLALPTTVAGAMDSIAVQGERATAQYWTERTADGDALLLTPAEITAVNQKIRQPNSWMTDLAKYPETVSADSIREKIVAVMGRYADESLPELYKNGKRLTQYSFDFAKKNCNLDAIPAMQNVRYAVAAQRIDMRLLPEAAGWLDSPDELDSHYDNLQGTAVDPAEPMAVLAESYNHQFVFALTRNYMGWVPMGAIAFTDRKNWMEYVAPKNFLVVTANKKKVPVGGAWYVTFQMGSVIPLAASSKQDGKWIARIPVNVNMQMSESLVPMEDDDTVHLGWLPCTKNNFIRQGFRFLGDVYGWGGQDESVDCSSFVGDVYRTMGIELPRDADKQEELMPVKVSLAGLDTSARYQRVRNSLPGALFFKYGLHVMLYLGQDSAGTPMVLHSASSYFTFPDGEPEKQYIRQVIVSDLHYMNASQVETIDGMSSIGSLK